MNGHFTMDERRWREKVRRFEFEARDLRIERDKIREELNGFLAIPVQEAASNSALAEENAALKAEVKALKLRVGGMKMTIARMKGKDDDGTYGLCPVCGAEGVEREKHATGFTWCKNHHRYPTMEAIQNKA
jgi:RNA polymerase-binding transcription factor DksA